MVAALSCAFVLDARGRDQRIRGATLDAKKETRYQYVCIGSKAVSAEGPQPARAARPCTG